MTKKKDGLVPSRKTGSSAAIGGVTVILVWIAKAFGNVDVPAEVASSFTAILMAATAYVVPNAE